ERLNDKASNIAILASPIIDDDEDAQLGNLEQHSVMSCRSGSNITTEESAGICEPDSGL
ncbi:hypothetical protein BVRB_023880, partial [Beta vulgaris subsp. vulgaris]